MLGYEKFGVFAKGFQGVKVHASTSTAAGKGNLDGLR